MKQYFYPAIFAITTLLTACGGGGDSDDGPANRPAEDLSDARAYRPNAPYSSVIADCIRITDANNGCVLRTLPLIGMETDTVTIDDIMDRVVVSHDWMAENFRELLETYPAEFLPLFRAVTAVVIDDNIRPANYKISNGAIFLDPFYLWFTNAQKQTISKKEDFRSGFSDPLIFRSAFRYVKDGQPAYRSGSLDDANARSKENTRLLLANLLLHELAHANDFVPPDIIDQLNPNLNMGQTFESESNRQISSRLYAALPTPESAIMFSLAKVMFQGKTPNTVELTITAESVGEAFEPDATADDYGYNSVFEDTAMLFERAMMMYFFDVEHDVAYLCSPGQADNCGNYRVGWGVRHRIGDTIVKERAQFVAEAIFPDIEFDLFFQNLPVPVDLPYNAIWSTTIDFENDVNHHGHQKPTLLESEEWRTFPGYL